MQRFSTLVLGLLLSVTAAFADATGFTVEQHATSAYGTTYRVYATFDDPGDWVYAVFGLTPPEGNIPMSLMAEGTASIFQQPIAGVDLGQSINTMFFSMVPDLAYDSWLTIGTENSTGDGGAQIIGMASDLLGFNAGTGFSDCGGSWFVASLSGAAPDWMAGDDLRVLLAQITMSDDDSGNPGHFNFQFNLNGKLSDGSVFELLGDQISTSELFSSATGCTDSSACNYDASATEDDGSCDFESCVGCLDNTACNYDANLTIEDNTQCDYVSCAGCTDADACNYDASATQDDGSCLIPDAACDVCEGGAVVNYDEDGDGVCDDDEVVGCQDVDACNYNALATDAGECNYVTQPCEVCLDGVVVLQDADLDGICDANETSGCTDEGACNFNVAATDDDGSCEFDSCAGCTDNTACNYDSAATLDDASCEYVSCAGCTDNTACNYDASATVDDASCEFLSCAGCTDVDACNYDSGATLDDESCEYPAAYYDCAGDCLFDFDGDGICNELEIVGCTDPTACNYDASATDDAGCIYPPVGGDCDSMCTGDFDGDGICDNLEVPGCTSTTATNYNATATDEDGSCLWDDAYFVGLSYELIGHNTVEGASTYRLYAEFNTDNVAVQACFGTEADPWSVFSTQPFYQDDLGAGLGHAVNPAFFAMIPSLEFDSWLALGAGPGDAPAPSDVGLDAFNGDFNTNGGNLLVNTVVGASIYYTPGASDFEHPVAGKVLLGQFTTEGVVSVKYNFQFRDAANATHQVADVNLTFPANNSGCTDDTACNYDADVEFSNPDLCEYAETGYDCDGICLTDTDGDGVCDDFEVVGCQDETACDFSSEATDAGECNYAETGYDCDGVCLLDTDEDGVCDPFEVVGCQDSEACNFDPAATDAGTCEYPEEAIDCDGNCLNDLDEDGVCDEFEVVGCTDPQACNFDAAATDPGECILPEGCDTCTGETDGTGTVINNDTDGDGVCDADEVPGCTDSGAANYNPEATDNDGSCLLGDCDDPLACNYVEDSASPNTEACEYPAPFFDCEGNCTGDYEGDGICEGEEIWGCASSSALNFDPEATSDDGSCEWGADVFQGLTYEVVTDHETGPIAGNGYVTYRIYAQFSTSNIDLVQLFGSAENPWTISNTGDTYQDLVGDFFGGNISLALFSFFPSVEFDSWLTIGAVPGDYNALNQSGMYAYLPEWNTTGQFNADDAEASISVTPTQSDQGVPDENGRVLLAQITTNGVGHLRYNILFHPEVGEPISFTDVELIFPTQVPGCTNPLALNYEANANSDDGSCAVEGCMSPDALNFDPTANLEDGSCLFGGCTDDTADNFDPIANVDDESCLYTGCMDEAADNYNAQANTGDQEAECIYLGCTSSNAINYDAGANQDDGTCLFVGCYDPEADNYNPIANTGNQSVLCKYYGCTDPEAVNFDETANFNDGTCDYLGCTDANADNYDPQATIDDGACEYLGCTDVDADNYDEQANVDDGSCLFTGCYDTEADNFDLFANTGDQEALCEYWGCMDAFADNYDATANAGDQEALCIYFGCTDETADNFDPQANSEDGSCLYFGCTDSDADNFDATANEDDGSCIYLGCTNIEADNFDATANEDDDSCQFTGCMDVDADNYWSLANTGDQEAVCEYLGCTIETADNYDPTANVNDGSCVVAGCLYLDAINFNPDATYDDQSCIFQTVGCTDPLAWNYMASATEENGTCLYGGCTYEIAFNFDPAATVDDGSCEWYGCLDASAVNFDADATHDDGSCEIVGCMDVDGINYNADATFSGYCEYPDVCPGDINGDLSVDVQDLLTFFQYYGTFCD